MSELQKRLRSAGVIPESLGAEAADALDALVAETATQAQEIARLTRVVREADQIIGALRIEGETLRAKSAALRARLADAERYRWLRQERYMFREGATITCDEQAETVAIWVKCPVANSAEEVDAAIDKARAGAKREDTP